MKKFEIDNKLYETDEETLNVLKSIIPNAKQTNDTTAVFAVMHFGLLSGRIKEITAYKTTPMSL